MSVQFLEGKKVVLLIRKNIYIFQFLPIRLASSCHVIKDFDHRPPAISIWICSAKCNCRKGQFLNRAHYRFDCSGCWFFFPVWKEKYFISFVLQPEQRNFCPGQINSSQDQKVIPYMTYIICLGSRFPLRLD